MLNRPWVVHPVYIVLLWLVTTAGCASHEATEPPPTAHLFLTATPRSQPTAGQTQPTLTPDQVMPTATYTPTPAFTFTPTLTQTPSPTLAVTPTTLGICPHQPDDVFALVYRGDAGLPSALGCPRSPEGLATPETVPRIWVVVVQIQLFENGSIVWLSNWAWVKRPFAYLLEPDNVFSFFDYSTPLLRPTSTSSLSPATAVAPGLLIPGGDIGELWSGNTDFKRVLGYAISAARTGQASMQVFDFGEMVHIESSDLVYVFKRGTPNTWSSYTISKESSGTQIVP